MEFKIHDLDAVVELLSGVHRYDDYYMAQCCFHDDKKPSMRVSSSGYYCLACQKGGSLEYLLSFLTQGKVKPTVKKESSATIFPSWKKWVSKFGDYEGAAVEAFKTAISFPSLMSSVLHRGLSQEDIKRGRIGWIENFISFPVFSPDGKFIDWVVRHKSQKLYVVRPRIDKQEGTSLYSPDWKKVFTANEIYVPFGIFDVWTMDIAGYAAVTGLTGKSYNPEWFCNIRKVINIIPDYNELDAAMKLKSALGWRGRILNLQYPDGCKDPNDVHQLYGIDAVRRLITS